MSGLIQSYDPISSVTPVCDIRTQGAVINGSTAIDSAVQACINYLYTLSGGGGTVFLPCIKSGGTGAGGLIFITYTAGDTLFAQAIF